VSELTLVAGDIKHENIVYISSKADTVLAVSGQSNGAQAILLICALNAAINCVEMTVLSMDKLWN